MAYRSCTTLWSLPVEVRLAVETVVNRYLWLLRVEVVTVRDAALAVVTALLFLRAGELLIVSEAALVLVVTDRSRARVADPLSPAVASKVVR